MQRFSWECCSNFCRESISPGFCWCAKPREATGVSEVRFSCEGSSRRLGDRELYMFYYIRQGVTHPKKIMWSWVYHLNSLGSGRRRLLSFEYCWGGANAAINRSCILLVMNLFFHIQRLPREARRRLREGFAKEENPRRATVVFLEHGLLEAFLHEVRQGTLGVDTRCWGPAGNTGRGWSWLRSRREHWAWLPIWPGSKSSPFLLWNLVCISLLPSNSSQHGYLKCFLFLVVFFCFLIFWSRMNASSNKGCKTMPAEKKREGNREGCF